MKLTSMTIASGAPAMSAVSLRASSPSCALTRGIGGEARVELAVADVDRHDRARAALEQDVGEAAGRGADVEAGEAVRIEVEGDQRGGELDAAARGPRMRRARLDVRVLGERVGGLAHGLAVGADQPGGDRRLGARPAGEQSAFDEKKIGALAHVGLAAKRGHFLRRAPRFGKAGVATRPRPSPLPHRASARTPVVGRAMRERGSALLPRAGEGGRAKRGRMRGGRRFYLFAFALRA